MTRVARSHRCVRRCVLLDVGAIVVIGSEVLPLSLCVEIDYGKPLCSVLCYSHICYASALPSMPS